ncbi:MAG: ROK family protein, partial [Clostridia bacterium]|nr:ROK family protein [Clostridia bacterium]
MYRIGIDLGGINIACGLVTEDGKLVAKKSVPTRTKNDTPDSIAKSMVDVSLDVIAENNLKEDDVALIGIGIPGAVDRDRGF